MTHMAVADTRRSDFLGVGFVAFIPGFVLAVGVPAVALTLGGRDSVGTGVSPDSRSVVAGRRLHRACSAARAPNTSALA